MAKTLWPWQTKNGHGHRLIEGFSDHATSELEVRARVNCPLIRGKGAFSFSPKAKRVLNDRAQRLLLNTTSTSFT
ncbi:uncharacterized protein G2W53_010429 [Senna tora]|uniref:Uncharacterized protein n=1 Tax=Senna tora TaxID=362788 RepID=A0A834X0P0_9FABA|nr:uncharacterized protein G2W53_010429 [Senna tora]